MSSAIEAPNATPKAGSADRLRLARMAGWRLNAWRVSVFLALMGVWEILAHTVVNPLWVSQPSAVAVRLWDLARSGLLWRHTSITLLEAGLGLALAFAVGVPIGILLARYKYAGQVADPNIANIFRAHHGFVEDLLNLPQEFRQWRDEWFSRIGRGETIGSGFSETGDTRLGSHSTQLVRSGDIWRLNGEKYYTTGSLYADWIHIGAIDGDGEPIGALVPTGAEGVEIIDDWDGFGQALTASGTARFTGVKLRGEWIKPTSQRFSYSTGFFQLVHLATLSGIGRAATVDLAELVSSRTRVYARGNGQRSSDDPQVLQVVGRIRAAAYAAGAIALKAAEALQAAYEANLSGDPERIALANRNADLEVSQSVTPVTSLVLDATTQLFDALGASAARRVHALDRHWRNARTISSHNPRIYHDRIVGDFAVNGAVPGPSASVGTISPSETEKEST